MNRNTRTSRSHLSSVTISSKNRGVKVSPKVEIILLVSISFSDDILPMCVVPCSLIGVTQDLIRRLNSLEPLLRFLIALVLVRVPLKSGPLVRCSSNSNSNRNGSRSMSGNVRHDWAVGLIAAASQVISSSTLRIPTIIVITITCQEAGESRALGIRRIVSN